MNIPSLRDRPDDILPLTYRIMEKELERNEKRAISLHGDTEAIINFYDWPGNLHELFREVSRFVSASSSFSQIQPKHLSSYILHSMKQNVAEKNDWVKVGCYSGLTTDVFDRALIEKALDQFSWDQEFTSEFLSLTVDELEARIKELKIEKRKKSPATKGAKATKTAKAAKAAKA